MASRKRTVKKVAKEAKKHPEAAIAVAVLLVILIIAVAVLWYFKPDVFHNILGTGEHTWSEWEETPATCTKDGERRRRCTVCGDEESEVLTAHGHSFGAELIVKKQATCGEEGSGYRKCVNCDAREEEIISPTYDHKYGEGVIVKQAACNDGEIKYICSVCGDDYSEIIKGTGAHVWSEWDIKVPSTCGDGLSERECSVCGETESTKLAGDGNHNFIDGVCTVCGGKLSSPEALIKNSDLSILFLELGSKKTGDCILIKCGETEVLIDAGAEKGSAVEIKSYLDEYVEGELDYVITTHADQDHIAAYVGTGSGNDRTGILYGYDVGTIIKFSRTNKTTQIYKDYLNAVSYAESRGAKVYTAEQCYNQTDGASRQYYLDDEKSISINILYNYYYFNKSSDENNYSVVTLLTEELADGNKHYLFTGDLEKDGEKRLAEYYKSVPAEYRTEYNILPEVELYKAGHHGSKTSSTDALLSVIKPKNVVVCCCCGSPEYTLYNENTFPTQIMIDNVSKYTDNIYVTSLAIKVPEVVDGKISEKKWEYASMNGNVVFYDTGGKLNLYCSNNDTKLKDTEWFKNNRT